MGPQQGSQGQRPRPYLGRDPGRLRQGALTLELRVAAPSDPDLVWDWALLLREQSEGGDPTADWRARLARSTGRQYATSVPAAMPAAFVLQWALEVAATAGAYAALHHAWVVSPAEAGLTFALHEHQLYPVAAQWRHHTVTPALLDDRVEAARAAYLTPARGLAGSYDPGVNLGTRTRLAMVDDVWAMAVARVRGGQPPRRESCCFIYVLPGVHECSGCPRLAPQRGTT